MRLATIAMLWLMLLVGSGSSCTARLEENASGEASGFGGNDGTFEASYLGGSRLENDELAFDLEQGSLRAEVRRAPWLSVELRLTGIGRERLVEPRLVTEAERAEHTARRKFEGLVEWFVVEPTHLEHGFTLERRPEGRGPLRLEIALDGELQAVATPRGMSLVDDRGQRRLSYTDLVSFDADGDPLPSRMRVQPDRVVLEIDDDDASYPVVVDPLLWIEEQKMLGSAAGTQDYLGTAIDVDGTTAAVGAYGWEQGTTQRAGTVYMYERVAGTWVEQQQLVPADPGANFYYGNLGRSVALSGDTLLVSAPGVNGGEGAAYVYRRSGGVWSLEQKLLPADLAADDSFGYAVALDGDVAAIASDNDDDLGPESGSVYVFTRSGTTWTEQQKLLASDGAPADHFGYSLALSGDTLVVGSPRHDALGSNAGAVYAFFDTGSGWVEEAKLLGSGLTTQSRFGWACAADLDTVVISSQNYDYDGTAWVFVRTGPGTWAEEATLVSAYQQPGDGFGRDLDIEGDTIVVGANNRDGMATSAGAVSVFDRIGGVWTETQELVASDGTVSDDFGRGVGMSIPHLVVGAPDDDFGFFSAGAAYAFLLFNVTATPCTLPSECPSGFCVDGFCCDAVCGDACDACDRFGLEGLCGPRPAGETGVPSCLPYTCDGTATTCPSACSDASDCALGNYCGGSQCLPFKYLGDPCGADNECLSGFCVDGLCCNEACTGDCAQCDLPSSEGICEPSVAGSSGSPICAPHLCDGVSQACPTSCSTDAGCLATHYCDAGTCTAKQTNGAICTAPNACQSGQCVDGRCCDSACSGVCEACDLATTEGQCTVVAQGADPDAECAAGACNGAGACAQNDGETCLSSSDCLSGSCVDGVCCDGPCNGNCESCAVSGAVGQCTPIAMGNDPDNECVAGACNGQGACASDNGGSCTNSGDCLSNLCVDSICCDSACTGSCDACDLAGTVGTCTVSPLGTTGSPSCAPFVCDGAATGCPTTCASDSDCGAGYWCDGSTCNALLSLGVACTGDNQCATTICVDGVCCDGSCGAGATNDCQACSTAAGGATDGTCGPVQLQANLVCRPATDVCDQDEICDGASVACPADALVPSGTDCRPAAGECDMTETCDGASAVCPPDALASATTVCRTAEGPCDAEELCDGASVSCPADAPAADGASCDDQDPCTDPDQCNAGVCVPGVFVCEEPTEPVPPPTDGGCGCRLEATRRDGLWGPWLFLLGSAVVLRRRRCPRGGAR